MTEEPSASPESEECSVADNDYIKYRGKCQEFAEQAVRDDPTLTLVRGHYWDPIWGQQAHWWTKRADDTIYDPTKDQFPSKGAGVYEEFDGYVECAECGKRMPEEEASYESRYAFCSGRCYGRFVGVYI